MSKAQGITPLKQNNSDQIAESIPRSITFSGSDIEIKSSGFFLITTNDQFSNHIYILCFYLSD